MADDIVSRLRSENRMALAPFHMSDAADEIERLRAMTAEQGLVHDAWLTERSLADQLGNTLRLVGNDSYMLPLDTDEAVTNALDAYEEARREQ